MTLTEGFAFCEADLFKLRDELYDGSWKLFLIDLHNRLDRFPLRNAINKRIRRDIKAIQIIMQG